MSGAYLDNHVVIGGLDALVVGQLARRAIESGVLERMRLSADQSASAEKIVGYLEHAGAKYADLARVAVHVSECGNVSAPDAEIARSFGDECGTAAAAAALGLTTRRVRQLASQGLLGGRRSESGEWIFTTAAVAAYAERMTA